jgi:hypothetical protein
MAVIKRFRSTLALLPLFLAGTSMASAQEATTQASESAPPAAADQQAPSSTVPDQQAPPAKKWEFATIGYVWFAGAWGETDVIGPVPPVGLKLPFGTVLKGLKFAFMGAAEARHDRFVALGDLTFIHLEAKKGIDIRDRDFLDAELDSRTAEVTLLGGYRVVNEGPVTVDLLAGGRVNFFKTTLQLEGPNRSAEGSVKQTWFDPLVGARAIAPLGGKWSLALYGDIGGFGIGSDLTWQGIATVNYQISRKMSLGAGWRHFKVNYDHGDFLYNVYQTGPIITFRTIL